MAFKRAGLFREIDGDQKLPSLRDGLGDEPQEHEADIVAYLRSGVVLVASPGPAFDVLSESRQIAGPQHLLYDGTWSWPAELAYYVERYHCRLPGEFIDHMRSRDWRPPVESEVSDAP